ncbi:MAG: DNA translocase FtsK 4TM domain-containing protein [Rhodoferax sp.]|nr:DNA translocase FtsK 4TM domain-containing protein [Rhodoferax sp.]
MTYSLDSLNSAARQYSDPRYSGVGRFTSEVWLVVACVLFAFWLLAMVGYSPLDAAWSTSGDGSALRNRLGRLGALTADASYFAFGFSVWWCFVAGLRAWLAALAVWLRQGDPAEPVAPGTSLAERWLQGRAARWLGLALLLASSCILEWSRLYSLEPLLPGTGGGVVGAMLGPLALQWLGFTGSGLAAIALGLAGAALALRFSWAALPSVLVWPSIAASSRAARSAKLSKTSPWASRLPVSAKKWCLVKGWRTARTTWLRSWSSQ